MKIHNTKILQLKFSKNLSELDDIIEDMRKYNNKNNPVININKKQ
jgi:hypothetical protein